MSAITGILYRDTELPVARSLLCRMNDLQAHRGSGGEKLFLRQNIGLGTRFLTSQQKSFPIEFSTAAGKLVILLDGEIYNGEELREQLNAMDRECETDGDGELIARLYEVFGLEKMFPMLRGKFSIAIWNETNQELLLARDPIGQKPLYFYQDEEKFLFASELKAILAHERVLREIHPTAIEDYFIMGAIPGERTIYKDIFKVPSGSWVTYRPLVSLRRERCVRYWEFQIQTEENLSEEEWEERIQNQLMETVAMMKWNHRECGAFLSGGLDSSIVVALQSRFGCESIPTFTVGFKESQFNELEFAEAIADRFGADMFQDIVEPDAVEELKNLVECFDEPYSDPSSLPTLLVARLAARHVSTVLSGDGGDECFAGYARQIHDMKEDAIRRFFPAFLRRGIFSPLGAIWPKLDGLPRYLRFKTVFTNLGMSAAEAYANTVSFCRNPLRKRLLRPLMEMPGYAPSDIGEQLVAAFQAAPAGDTLAGMQMAEIRVGLPEAMVKVDRTTMSCGLEVRSPFLDTKVMELAARLPSEYKIRNGLGKWILRKIYEPQFPVRLKGRPKQGFELPTDIWLRGPLSEIFREEVLNPGSPISSWIDLAVTKQLFDEHLAQKGNHGGVLWALLVLNQWAQRWKP